MNEQIAYKWVVKKKNKYYSLMNYGIDNKLKRTVRPYHTGKTYSNFTDLNTLPRELGAGKGFHFWKNDKNIQYDYRNYIYAKKENWEKFINHKITCVKCRINNVVAKNNFRYVAQEFEIIEEIN